MSSWREVFLKLGGNVFARWYASTEGYVYMYVPEVNEIGDDGFEGESVMKYDEIEKIVIPKQIKHGNLKIENDIERISEILYQIDGIKVISSEDGISIELV